MKKLIMVAVMLFSVGAYAGGFNLETNLGVSLPTQDAASGIDTSEEFSLEVASTYEVIENVRVGASFIYGKHALNTKNPHAHLATVHSYAVLAIAEYAYPVGVFAPYVQAGVGFAAHSVDKHGGLDAYCTTGCNPSGTMNLAATVGIGNRIKMGKHLSFNTKAAWLLDDSDIEANTAVGSFNQGVDISNVILSAGLTWSI